jgi:hypothetical protein
MSDTSQANEYVKAVKDDIVIIGKEQEHITMTRSQSFGIVALVKYMDHLFQIFTNNQERI